MTESVSANEKHLVVLGTGEWRTAPLEAEREYLALMPEGLFVVQDARLYRYARPATSADFTRLFGPRVRTWERGSWSGGVVLADLIPWEFLTLAASFFRSVWKQERREDVLLLYYYHEAHRYDLAHPEVLTADEIRIEYAVPETPADAVRFGTFHSHGRAEAYHSLTDERSDLASPGVHVIIGLLDQSWPSLLTVFSDGRECFRVDPIDLFTLPEQPAVPDAWFVSSVRRSVRHKESTPRSSAEGEGGPKREHSNR